MLPVDVSVALITVKDTFGERLELVERHHGEPEPPVLEALGEDELGVAVGADVEVHPVPVEVLVLLRLELDPGDLEVGHVWKMKHILQVPKLRPQEQLSKN